MTEAEKERAAIVEWLKDRPFPWVKEHTGLLERIQVAWHILIHGAAIIRGMLAVVACKVERGDHLK